MTYECWQNSLTLTCNKKEQELVSITFKVKSCIEGQGVWEGHGASPTQPRHGIIRHNNEALSGSASA